MSSPSIAPRSNQSISTSGSANHNSNNPKITKIITSKQWILPPRPKPGRKPSIDTPATKRKAQNRAAQRAFRERRANRVSELETQILELEREKSVKEGILTNTIKGLQNQNDSLKKSIEEMRQTLELFQNQLNGSKPSRRRVSVGSGVSPTTIPESSVSTPQPSQPNTPAVRANNKHIVKKNSNSSALSTPPTSNDLDLNKAASMMIDFKNSSRHNSMSSILTATSPLTMASNYSNGSANTDPNSSRKDRNLSSVSLQQISPAPSNSSNSPPSGQFVSGRFGRIYEDEHNKNIDEDCGICEKDDCICETVGLKNRKTSAVVFDDFEPAAAVPLKRSRPIEQEIDFTNTFTLKKMKKLPVFKSSKSQDHQNDLLFKSPINLDLHDASPPQNDVTIKREYGSSFAPEDQCGFCSDDTPCVCREIAKQKELVQIKDSMITNQLNDKQEKTSTTRDMLQSEQGNQQDEQTNKAEGKDGCSGNPGSCRQCQQDPISTLFCTTIAQQLQKPTLVKPFTGSSTQGSTVVSSSEFLSSVLSNPDSMGTGSPLSNPSRNTSATPSILPTPPSLETLKRSSSMTSLPALGDLEINNPGKHFIPCADAYKTLSRHANFRTAGFNNIISNLNTKGMYVEVESVVNCLRQLDRKFGSN